MGSLRTVTTLQSSDAERINWHTLALEAANLQDLGILVEVESVEGAVTAPVTSLPKVA